MSKTYLTAKIGKSIKFNPNTWSGAGGDNEAPTLIRKMAELNPDDNFIVIGRNDLDKQKTKLGLPTNLHSAWAGLKVADTDDNPGILWDMFKDTQIDGVFLIGGPTGSTNLLQRALKRRPLAEGKHEFAQTLEMHLRYSGPIYEYLNKSGVPWIMINNDPRYLKMGRDCLNMPQEILSQFDGIRKNNKIKSWDDQVELENVHIPYSYAGMEKIFLIDTPKPKIEDFNKTIGLMIPLNEGNNGVRSRYPELKKYVLDHIDDVDIYGNWNKDTIGDDQRFKGSMSYHELQDTLDKVKYGFMISISDGWVTMKLWELISHGVIPFMHPNYDSQKHIKVPEFIRITEPQDLHNKIEMLENDPDLYRSILQECLDLISNSDIDGTTLNNTILSTINKYDYQQNDKSYNDKIAIQQSSSLDDW